MIESQAVFLSKILITRYQLCADSLTDSLYLVAFTMQDQMIAMMSGEQIIAVLAWEHCRSP